jgi:hypothetical protein
MHQHFQIHEPVWIPDDLPGDHYLLYDQEPAMVRNCLTASFQYLHGFGIIPIMQNRFQNVCVIAGRNLDKKTSA